MNFKHIPIFIIFILSTILISCTGGEMSEKIDQFPIIKDVPAAKWEKLAQKKIYFGHHSVGANIIDGIKDLMKENPNIKLNIVKTANESDFKVGLFAHSGVGKNGDPKSKMLGFAKVLNSGIGEKADAAALKFCYVDILLETDVDGMLGEYSDSVAELKKKYPDLKIIHFTTPLMVQKTTWKHLVKKILSIKDPWRYGSNIKRNEYNQKLVEKYQDKDPILDIAMIESTYPNGSRCAFKADGKTYFSLVPEYTYDGGHLNEVGRKKVAEQLLLLLANLN